MASYYTVHEILTELENTSGSNDKIAILQREFDNNELKEVVKMALDPFITYGIKNIPEYKKEKYGAINLSKALATIKERIVGTQRSQKTLDQLVKILCQVDENEAEVIERVIKKDLRCGVSTSTVNKVWEGLIPVFEVMLAQKATNKTLNNIEFPAYVQTKFDGMRVNVIIQPNGNYQVFSRNGKPVEIFGKFDSEVGKFANSVLDGELLCVDENGEYLDRKTSNGICNKAIRGTITPEEANKIVMVVWDAIPIENVTNGKATVSMPYSKRLNFLETQFSKGVNNNVFRLASTATVNSMEEVYTLFAQELSKGEEGIVLKNINSQWVPKRSNDMIKFKAENTADLEIVDVVEGSGKVMGKLGSFLCRTKDGLLETSVGTGFSDEQREDYFSRNYIGSVIEVTYNEIIQAKGKKLPSLFLPVFQQMREDKSEANLFEELK